MIPKVIHYCWFGGAEFSPLAKKCIASWKKYCPDYEIIQWNENNYPINEKCQFVRDAYHYKKWAFVSDYARLDIIYNYGGIYLDTDVEMIKKPDELLQSGLGYMGFSDPDIVADGLGFAAERGSTLIREMMDMYNDIKFSLTDMSKFTCPEINTAVLVKHGLKLDNTYQIIDNMRILPMEYLCPINLHSGEKYFSNNTLSIHHFSGSWMPESERRRMKFFQGIKRILTSPIIKVARKIMGSNKDE